MVGYYAKFIDGYGARASELTDMLKKSVSEPLVWADSAIKAFDDLRSCLSSKHLHRGPDYSKPFILHSDASLKAIGGVICQKSESGADQPIAFASRKLLARERNYSIIELELLAILYLVDKFRNYLWGNEFVIYCDHRPLSYLESKNTIGNARLTRWALSLQPYRYRILHRPGRKNLDADFLSRLELED